MTAPQVLYEVHCAYVEAGAEVITANTFSSARHILEPFSDRFCWQEANRAAVRLARDAAATAEGRLVWVAGSISTIPPLDAPHDIPRGPDVRDNFRRQADVLAEAGVDLMLVEMMIDPDGAEMATSACLETGLPVWVGYSASFPPGQDGGQIMAFRTPGAYRDMTPMTFRELLRRSPLEGIDLAGVMHTKMPHMTEALRIFREEWSGPLMAYAETGKFDGELDWAFDDAVSPQRYAETAKAWIRDFGARAVGGCCGTGPEHTAAMRDTITAI